MLRKDKPDKRRDSAIDSPESDDSDENGIHVGTDDDITSILSERLRNLEEAIDEIDTALASRKTLSARFLKQIDGEMQEIHHHLGGPSEPVKILIQIPKVAGIVQQFVGCLHL